MRKSSRHEFRQTYNVQAVVDADGSQPVLTTKVAQTPSDGPTFEDTIIQLCSHIGQLDAILGCRHSAAGRFTRKMYPELLPSLTRDNKPNPSHHRFLAKEI